MAILRLSLTNIRDIVRLAIGEQTSATSRVEDANTTTSTASLNTIINSYAQQISNRLTHVMRQAGLSFETEKVYPDFWRTSGSMTETEGSSSVTFPADYDRYISFYDRTNRKPIVAVEAVSKWHLERLRRKSAGPPEAIEILGVNTSSVWTGTLWPPTESGVTPDIELTYWRLPAIMDTADASNTYPDAPPNFHLLWVYGAVLQLTRPDDPNYTRFQALESEMLLELAQMARAA